MTTKRRTGARRAAVALAAASGMFLMTACAGDQAETMAPLADSALGSDDVVAQMDELYRTAMDEGQDTVVVYGPGEQLYSKAYETFMDRYPGIHVIGEYIYGAELTTRLDQEFASDTRVGSIQTGGPAMTSAAAKAGRCDAYEPFTAKDLHTQGDADDDTYRAVVGYPFGIAYNTDLIDEEDLPHTFADLSEEKFNGEFVLEDPRTTNGTANSMAQMRQAGIIDEAWLEKVAHNGAEMRANSALTVQAVATGQAAFDPFGQYVQYIRPIQEGLPLGYYVPTDQARIEFHYTCMLKEAPNTAASELLYNWFFTEEGQTAFTQAGVYGVRPNVPAPDGLPPFSEVSNGMIPTSPVSEAGSVTKDFLDVAKKYFK